MSPLSTQADKAKDADELAYDKLMETLIDVFREKWPAACDYEIMPDGESVHIVNKDDMAIGTITYDQLSAIWDVAEARLSKK